MWCYQRRDKKHTAINASYPIPMPTQTPKLPSLHACLPDAKYTHHASIVMFQKDTIRQRCGSLYNTMTQTVDARSIPLDHVLTIQHTLVGVLPFQQYNRTLHRCTIRSLLLCIGFPAERSDYTDVVHLACMCRTRKPCDM
jgi:hypothetical protein